MSLSFDDLVIGGQLRVGTGIVAAIKEGDDKINGSMFSEGPVVFGGPTEFPDNYATLMVGRTRNVDYNDSTGKNDCVPADRSLYVKGNTFIEGDSGTSNALNVSGDTNVDGTIDSTGTITSATQVTAAGHNLTAKKNFDIPHPTKEGWRLRHVCLEGNEAGVYFRGKVRNRNVIQLPKYWEKLVDYTTITVNLTPIGAHQNVIVKRVDESKIYLQAQGGMPINCYFHVFGERIDGERLIPEYEGTSIDDYPGDNTQYTHNK